MRFPFAAFAGIVVATLLSTAAFAQDRYGAASSASSSSSSNRFEDLFSKESTRSTPAGNTSSSTASGKRGSSTFDLRPLSSSATGTSPRSSASTTPSSGYNRNSSVLTGTSQDRFARDRSTNDRSTGDRSFDRTRQIDQGGRRETATREMLSRMLQAHPNSRLTGTPMPLSSLLSGSASRDRQSQLIEAYWALTSATADYYLGLHEADELGKLRQRVPTYSTALNEALSHLNGRVDTSLKAAKAAQLHLGRLTNAGTRTLPADTPFCGPYVTRYEDIFSGRGSEQARLLSELLPARLNELQEAAEAVERSEQWLSKVAADRAGGNGTGMIRALELLALNRRAFVQIAKDYNLQISRYTRLATPGDIDTGRLVAMLIRTSPTLANGRSLDFRDSATSSRR